MVFSGSKFIFLNFIIIITISDTWSVGNGEDGHIVSDGEGDHVAGEGEDDHVAGDASLDDLEGLFRKQQKEANGLSIKNFELYKSNEYLDDYNIEDEEEDEDYVTDNVQNIPNLEGLPVDDRNCLNDIHHAGYIYTSGRTNFMIKNLGMTEREVLTIHLPGDRMAIQNKNLKASYESFLLDSDAGISNMIIDEDKYIIYEIDDRNFVEEYYDFLRVFAEDAPRTARCGKSWCAIIECMDEIEEEITIRKLFKRIDTEYQHVSETTDDQKKSSIYDMFENNVAKNVGIMERLFGKCSLLACVDELYELGLTHNNPQENISKVKLILQNNDSRTIKKYTEFQQDYLYHLQPPEGQKASLPLNARNFCGAETCFDELRKGSYNYDTGIENKKNLDTISKHNLSNQRGYTKEYKSYIETNDDPVSPILWCVIQICYAELLSFGFSQATGEDNWKIPYKKLVQSNQFSMKIMDEDELNSFSDEEDYISDDVPKIGEEDIENKFQFVSMYLCHLQKPKDPILNNGREIPSNARLNSLDFCFTIII